MTSALCRVSYSSMTRPSFADVTRQKARAEGLRSQLQSLAPAGVNVTTYYNKFTGASEFTLHLATSAKVIVPEFMFNNETSAEQRHTVVSDEVKSEMLSMAENLCHAAHTLREAAK